MFFTFPYFVLALLFLGYRSEKKFLNGVVVARDIEFRYKRRSAGGSHKPARQRALLEIELASP